jgi:putative lumazine-binding protein
MTSTTSPEAAPAEAPTSAGDDAAIRKVVEHYYVGLRDANLQSLGLAFDDLAVVCGYMGTELFVKHVKTLYDFVVSEESPSKRGDPFTCKIDSISLSGGTAVVALTEQDYLGYDYATSLHLLRDETGAWSIVSKLFDGTPTTPPG